MYTTPLGDICHKNNLMFHLYADDTQLYMLLNPYYYYQKRRLNRELKLVSLISESGWPLYMLELNDDKTEFLVYT